MTQISLTTNDLNTITYERVDVSSNINNNIKGLKKNINKINEESKELFQVYKANGFENSVLKSDIFKYTINIGDQKIPMCKRESNSNKCGKVTGTTKFGMGGDTSSLISRKHMRFANIMTFYNLFNKLKDKTEIVPRSTNKSNEHSPNKMAAICGFGAMAAIFTGGLSLTLCIPILLTIMFSTAAIPVIIIKSIISDLNENLFFEIGKIKPDNSNKEPNPIIPIDDQYRYFMYVHFTRTWPQTMIKIPYIIKIHKDLLGKMSQIFNDKFESKITTKLPVNLLQASKDLTSILQNPDIPEEKINQMFKEISIEFYKGRNDFVNK